MFDDAGETIYQNMPSPSGLAQQVYEGTENEMTSRVLGFGEEELVVTSTSSDLLGWRIVTAVPVTVLDQKVEQISRISWVTTILLILVILLVSATLSYFVTKRLERLTNSIAQLETGDFDTQVAVEGKDEISRIASAFNHMVNNLRELINQKYTLELLKKQSEISALQSQINPHFLYNTLNTMKTAVEKENGEEAARMIQNLADVFRYAMANGDRFIPLGMEIEHLTKYIYLQKLRYQDRFEVSYDIPPDVLPLKVPRIILQPLVENAIEHGFEHLHTGGEISVTAQQTNNNLYIYISDNGKGMNPKEIKEMNTRLRENIGDKQITQGEHIGVYNVNARIRLMYGDEYGLTFFSTENVKNTVKLILHALVDSQ